MWFWDGAGDLVAMSNTGELGRSSFTWTVGNTHTLGIVAKGSSLIFKLDGSTLVTDTYSTGSSNTYVGIFSAEIEAGNANTFDNFKVIPAP